MRQLLAFSLLVLAACQHQSIDTAPPPPAPEIGYAWVAFGRDGTRASGASGLADRAEGRPITIDDPVRVASVSKLVVALGVMRLVEQGRLNLDEDVSKHLGWEVRNPRFPQTPITLRLLLSHRSSLKDDNEGYVIPLGKTVRTALADTVAFDPEHAPGTYFRYSNLNFPVIASVMERATGERFDRLMERLVLKPLALDACFNWTTCSQAKIDRGIALYNSDGSFRKDRLEERRAKCQVNSLSPQCDIGTYVLGSNGALFSPQGGFRISARDLAKVGQLLLNRGRHGGKPFLSAASIETVMKPAWRYNGSNGDTSDGFYCGYGLATQSLPTPASGCRDDLFGDGRQVVGHAGEAYGVLSGLWVDPRRRTGIAYFSTNNPREPVAGNTSYRAVEEWLAGKLRD
jgi:CubicO group peptidase (beta-lactamase class C family)